MKFDVTDTFSLEPVNTKLGVQIQWGSVNPSLDPVLRRWRHFLRNHPDCVIRQGAKTASSMRAANEICRAFMRKERARR